MFVFAFGDDTLVLVRSSPEKHTAHLHLLFERLSVHSVVNSMAESGLGVPTLDFLGHHLDATGIQPVADNGSVRQNVPRLN